MTLLNLLPSNLGHKDDNDWLHTEAWTCSDDDQISKDTLDLLFESAYAISRTNENHKRRKLHKNLVIISPLEPTHAEKSEISADTDPFMSKGVTGWNKKREEDPNRTQKSLDCELQFRSTNIKVRDVKFLYSKLEVSEDVSIRNMCISVLRSQAVVSGDVSPSEVRCQVLENIKIIDDSQSCEICGDAENTQNMLLCDQCEEAFHASCINLKTKTFHADQWFCQSCSKLRSKSSLEGQFLRLLENNCSNRNSRVGLSSIQTMMKYPEPYISRVRIGESFQAEVPEWSGQNSSYPYQCRSSPLDSDGLGEVREIGPSETLDLHVSFKEKLSKSNLLSNWLQCRGVRHDDRRGSSKETICGKWRRAPIWKVQTSDWDCSCSVLWDPSRSDCAVPQELPTEQVLLQLKYIEAVVRV